MIDLYHLVAVEHVAAVEGHIVGTMRPRADGDQETTAFDDMGITLRRDHLNAMRVNKMGGAEHGLDPVSGKLMLKDIDLVIEGHLQPAHQIRSRDILLDAVCASVEAALPIAGEIEHGLAQRLRRDRAGMNRNAADPATLLDDENRLADLGGLNGGPATGGTAADDDQIIRGQGWLLVRRVGMTSGPCKR